jgi:hypothetical protein
MTKIDLIDLILIIIDILFLILIIIDILFLRGLIATGVILIGLTIAVSFSDHTTKSYTTNELTALYDSTYITFIICVGLTLLVSECVYVIYTEREKSGKPLPFSLLIRPVTYSIGNTYVYMYKYIHAYICIYRYVYVYVYLIVYVCTYICMHTFHMNLFTYIYINICICLYNTHIFIDIHIHI